MKALACRIMVILILCMSFLDVQALYVPNILQDSLQAEELYCLGLDAFKATDYNTAVRLWKRAAKMGHADAQCNLGSCYFSGTGVSDNYGKASDWYGKAARQGHAVAQCNLGNCYLSGKGVEQDLSEAVSWYILSSEQ